MEQYVTWEGLFQFGIFLTGVIALVVSFFNNKRK